MALTYMKDKLPEFSGKDYTDFTERAKAFFYDQEAAGGEDRTLWDSIKDGDPRKDGPRKTTTHVEVQVVRLYPPAGDNFDRQIMKDERGNLIYDLVEQVVDEVEDAQEYLERCLSWDKDMAKVWRFLKRCGTSEASVMLRDVKDHDGMGAWSTWLNRWGSISLASTIRILEEVLEFKPSKGTTGQHITGWCELIRQLSLHKITLLPELESILFLKTLDSSFTAFVTDYKLRPETLKLPTEVYTAARAWNAEKHNQDEANNSGVALWLGGNGSGTPGGQKRQKMSCFNCDGDHMVRDCTHPCGYCGTKGHTKRDCKKRKAAAEARKTTPGTQGLTRPDAT